MVSRKKSKIQEGVAGRLYPEKEEPRLRAAERMASTLRGLFAPLVRPRSSRFRDIAHVVHSHGTPMKDWSERKILEKARELGLRLRREGYTKDLVARAFALVREVSRRTLGMAHFDVQLMGGWVLLQGMAAEMETAIKPKIRKI